VLPLQGSAETTLQEDRRVGCSRCATAAIQENGLSLAGFAQSAGSSGSTIGAGIGMEIFILPGSNYIPA